MSIMVTTRSVSLHGHRISYRCAGEQGPVILLLHGMASSSASWEDTLRLLGENHRVIAPDMLGHGDSEKPPGDYSLGAFASLARDLLVALDLDSATVVGHSLGGGVAMQILYQYPHLVDRLVLVDSGGLGRDVSPALRAVILPAAEYLMPLLFNSRTRAVGGLLNRMLSGLPVKLSPAMVQVGYALSSLTDHEARAAFVSTARSVLDIGGQRVDGRDRFYLTAGVPTLLVWGGKDVVIPVTHAHATKIAMPEVQLEIFERSGHFPQCEEPQRFAEVLTGFIRDTAGAKPGVGARRAAWRQALMENSALG